MRNIFSRDQVIHNAADKDTLEAKIARVGVDQKGDKTTEETTVKLELPEGWRLRLRDWRFINLGLLRQTLGFNVQEMPRQRARRMGLGGKMALLVDTMWQWMQPPWRPPFPMKGLLSRAFFASVGICSGFRQVDFVAATLPASSLPTPSGSLA